MFVLSLVEYQVYPSMSLVDCQVRVWPPRSSPNIDTIVIYEALSVFAFGHTISPTSTP